jgi:hypothetical protein
MQLPIRSLPLSSLKLADTWNLHPWDLRRAIPELAASFTRLGVLHPPVVVEDGPCFSCLAGYRRLQHHLSALHRNPDAKINCLVVPENSGVDLLLEIILCDQQSSAPLSLPEKARFVSIASNHLEEREVARNYFGRLGLANRPSTFNLLRDLLQQDTLIIDEAHADRLAPNMVESLLQLRSGSDRLELVRFFTRLHLGTGKQKRFFSLIKDICHRDGVSIKYFLQSDAIVSILEPEEVNVPQIINNLGKALERDLSPRYTLAEKEFGSKVRELELPPGHQISHCPYFEKDEVTLSITFESLEQCRSYLEMNNSRVLR